MKLYGSRHIGFLTPESVEIRECRILITQYIRPLVYLEHRFDGLAHHDVALVEDKLHIQV